MGDQGRNGANLEFVMLECAPPERRLLKVFTRGTGGGRVRSAFGIEDNSRSTTVGTERFSRPSTDAGSLKPPPFKPLPFGDEFPHIPLAVWY